MSGKKDTKAASGTDAPAKKGADKGADVTEPEVKLTPHQHLLVVLKENIQLLTKAVHTRERRLQVRALTRTTSIRKLLTYRGLKVIVDKYYSAALPLLANVSSSAMTDGEEEEQQTDGTASMEVEKEGEEAVKGEEGAEEADAVEPVPEVQAYVLLLVTLYLLNQKMQEDAATAATQLVEFVNGFNRRTLDLLSAKAYFYYSYTYECEGRLGSVREALLVFHRSACLKHNEPGQASLSIAIMRNYLHYNLYQQANQFRLNSTFPESSSNAQFARYLYYTARINSVQLNYTDALDNLNQALRKSPKGPSSLGFRQAATKLMSIVRLLTGEIPERSLFRQTDLAQSLVPYFELTRSVRVGDLQAFSHVTEEFRKVFVHDKTFSLIARLRHNVIKTGIRKINIAYSRISMKHIAEKLKLESAENAEYIVAKAIHDGVIDAVLDRENGFMFSKEKTDVYSTSEPQVEFHNRVQFCMDIYNDAVKAMRYPPNAHKTQAELKTEAEAFDNEDKEIELDPHENLDH